MGDTKVTKKTEEKNRIVKKRDCLFKGFESNKATIKILNLTNIIQIKNYIYEKLS